MGLSKERKAEYFTRTEVLINTYSKLFVVTVRIMHRLIYKHDMLKLSLF